MISHSYRCIFVHVPRTAGTSIEKALRGADWWEIEPSTKHLLASQAKEIYADYWDDYFTFSIVRHPVTRMVSTLGFGRYFCDDFDSCNSFADYLEGYKRQFGFPVTVEYDYRFHENVQSNTALENAVYRNILDEELDYIGKFEELDTALADIAEAIDVPAIELEHLMSAGNRNLDIVGARSMAMIEELFREDIEYFGYELPDP